MPIHLGVCLLLSTVFSLTLGSHGFASFINPPNSFRANAAIHVESNREDWLPLVQAENLSSQPPVRKLVVEEGSGDIAKTGSNVEIEYIGTLVGEKDWTSQDVVSCWLSELQGLNHLCDIFLEKDIDGSMLMDQTKLTEDFCMNELGISNKIQAKKLVMAAKRIGNQQIDHPAGTEFDSSIQRGKYFSFILSGGKVIKAMDLAVGSMRVGEKAKLVCRSDYAYGSEGLRSSKGDIIVPPFATLCFDLQLIKAE
jgi:hypothetical protein